MVIQIISYMKAVYVNKFIAYFEHVEREKVSQLSKYIARNVDDLELLLF